MARKGLSVTAATVPAINTQLSLIDGITQTLDLTGNLSDEALSDNVVMQEAIGPSKQISLSVPPMASKARIINYCVSGTSDIGETYLTNNAALLSDGATWFRDNTSRSALMLRISSNADGFDLFRAASGANPITWTNIISITSAGVIQVGTWQGTKIGLAYGGSNADLSATGGANQFVKQSSAGAAFTVGALGSGDVPDAALTSNVALLNRNAQQFTGSYNRFAQVGIGMAPSNILDITQSQNNASTGLITNTDTGVNSQVLWQTQSDTASVSIRAHSSGRTSTRYGVTLANYSELVTGTSGNGLLVGTSTLNAPIVMGTNGTERARIDGSGNVSVGTAALNTTATDGFLYIPSCAGPPTGTPTAKTGLVPMVYDSTNNDFYIYNGAWKKVHLA